MEKVIEVNHHPEAGRFTVDADGFTAYVSYEIAGVAMDIKHTIVPREIGGRGIASELVKAAYDYAKANGLRCVATCSYAAAWLERHPEYR